MWIITNTHEDETEKRTAILAEIVGELGEGSVVTRDIPSGCFAAGVPCRVIRPLTEADSMRHMPDILADNTVL